VVIIPVLDIYLSTGVQFMRLTGVTANVAVKVDIKLTFVTSSALLRSEAAETAAPGTVIRSYYGTSHQNRLSSMQKSTSTRGE
jgi:hypothetical protein